MDTVLFTNAEPFYKFRPMLYSCKEHHTNYSYIGGSFAQSQSAVPLPQRNIISLAEALLKTTSLREGAGYLLHKLASTIDDDQSNLKTSSLKDTQLLSTIKQSPTPKNNNQP